MGGKERETEKKKSSFSFLRESKEERGKTAFAAAKGVERGKKRRESEVEKKKNSVPFKTLKKLGGSGLSLLPLL